MTCAYLSHLAIAVENDTAIVIDGGMAKYKVQFDGKDAAVLDLSSYFVRSAIRKLSNMYSQTGTR